MLYLAHHGIKGQKWGVRRFQNKDGSYTNAGKMRYKKQYITKNEMALLGSPEFKKHIKKKYGFDIQDYNKDLIFEKGSKFKRVTKTKNEKDDRRKYITQEVDDYLNDWFASDPTSSYVKKYELKKDIMIAGYDKVNETLKKIGEQPLVDNPQQEDYSSDYNPRDIFGFNKNQNEEIQKKLTAELKKQGYSGAVDPVDPESGNSMSAYVIFKGETDKVLKEIGTYTVSDWNEGYTSIKQKNGKWKMVDIDKT